MYTEYSVFLVGVSSTHSSAEFEYLLVLFWAVESRHRHSAPSHFRRYRRAKTAKQALAEPGLFPRTHVWQNRAKQNGAFTQEEPLPSGDSGGDQWRLRAAGPNLSTDMDGWIMVGAECDLDLACLDLDGPRDIALTPGRLSSVHQTALL